MKYKVTRTYKYTATEEVEADSEEEAKCIPSQGNEERNHDDWWYDSEAEEIN